MLAYFTSTKGGSLRIIPWNIETRTFGLNKQPYLVYYLYYIHDLFFRPFLLWYLPFESGSCQDGTTRNWFVLLFILAVPLAPGLGSAVCGECSHSSRLTTHRMISDFSLGQTNGVLYIFADHRCLYYFLFHIFGQNDW